jgi:hypothetical protein
MTSIVLKQEIKKYKTSIVLWKFKLYGSVFRKHRHQIQYQHRISNNLNFDSTLNTHKFNIVKKRK